MYYSEVPADTTIFEEGAIGTCFFIIERGLIEIRTKDKPSK